MKELEYIQNKLFQIKMDLKGVQSLLNSEDLGIGDDEGESWYLYKAKEEIQCAINDMDRTVERLNELKN